ncbi:hypothetical protein HNY73_006384 [Argiope bruennichi]|uniref:Uncharacterized protein n=1 Tax=Argiope bruennichi TaxID=94029 RepID=A0A8T0FJV8_ARGBR|nr:hypothetical protein HNY73_006384 [Argiope bruennichi]
MRAEKLLRKNETETINDRNINRNPQECSVKLPRLQIPQFYGDILKFNDFYSQFDTVIHKNSSLSDVEKFNYLKSYLINDAEMAVRSIALKAENYDGAINILKERFGRTEMIIDADMSQLLNLNPVLKANDVKSLRRLYSICETHIRGLENNGNLKDVNGIITHHQKTSSSLIESVRPPKKNITPLRRSNAAITSSSTPDKKLEPVKENAFSEKTELDSSVKKEKDAKEKE